MKNTIAIILAAGKGTRMKSDLPKVLHKVCGKTMIDHVIDNCKNSYIENIYTIVGYKHEEIIGIIKENSKYILQEKQLGTGHALKQASEVLKSNFQSNVLVLMGDAPLISCETIEKLLKSHENNYNNATVLTSIINHPSGYGRIVKDDEGNLIKIVEQKDANELELQINEINSGMYCFDAEHLYSALEKLKNNNAQGEYYLTDVIEIMKNSDLKVGVVETIKEDIKAVNSRVELSQVERILQKRINDKLMENGVTIIDPSNTYINDSVFVGQDTIIYPGVIIEGNTKIGTKCIIGHNSRIRECVLGDNVEIQSSTLQESIINKGTSIGPYAYIRPNCIIGERVKIGDYVEVKNSIIGNDTKVSHLTYIGDAEVGDRVNLGCGVVFVNYNGKKKQKTIVEDDCFIGCNVNLIAPVSVKKGAYIAAGSTITNNVDEENLAIARCKQVNKVDYAKKLMRD